MPQKENNFSKTPQFINPKPWWVKVMPYLLYFLITLGGIIYLYWPEPYYVIDFLPGLTHLAALFNFGTFIVACTGYFIIRKFIAKKEGFKYSFYVFIANMTWVFIGLIFIGFN